MHSLTSVILSLGQTFAVQVYVCPPKRRFKSKEAASFNKLLGAWYDVFPFALPDVSGSLKATRHSQKSKHKEINRSIAKHNANAKRVRDGMSLESTHEAENLGNVCRLQPGLSNTLQRYFGEILVEEVYRGNSGKWRGNILSVNQSHRTMRRGGSSLPSKENEFSYTTERPLSKKHDLCYLRNEERPLAFSLRKDCSTIINSVTSITGMVAHFENLGHDEVEFVDGLSVNLLDFQRQSVQWCLQRETMNVQEYLWPQLPSLGNLQENPVYFNPIIETFKMEKPHVVRGGIIAEEMGKISWISVSSPLRV